MKLEHHPVESVLNRDGTMAGLRDSDRRVSLRAADPNSDQLNQHLAKIPDPRTVLKIIDGVDEKLDRIRKRGHQRPQITDLASKLAAARAIFDVDKIADAYLNLATKLRELKYRISNLVGNQLSHSFKSMLDSDAFDDFAQAL